MPGKVCAQNAAGPGDYAIAGTIKTLARIFVGTMGLEEVKARQIKALSKMKETKFQKRYAEVYNVLKGLPPALLAHYGLTEHMTKQEAVKKIRRGDKSDLIRIIDQIPDRVVVKYVKDCLRQRVYQWRDKTLLEQINSLWEKFIQKA